MRVYIRERSWLAKIAARRLRSAQVAMVIGHTVYLWGASRSEFLEDVRWVRHEMGHVYQYRRLGMLRFLWCYLVESVRNGYTENKFEREARVCEGDGRILDGVEFR